MQTRARPEKPVGDVTPTYVARPCASRCANARAVPESRRGCKPDRSEEHTSELQSLMRISYAVFCLKKKKTMHSIKMRKIKRRRQRIRQQQRNVSPTQQNKQTT